MAKRLKMDVPKLVYKSQFVGWDDNIVTCETPIEYDLLLGADKRIRQQTEGVDWWESDEEHLYVDHKGQKHLVPSEYASFQLQKAHVKIALSLSLGYKSKEDERAAMLGRERIARAKEAKKLAEAERKREKEEADLKKAREAWNIPVDATFVGLPRGFGQAAPEKVTPKAFAPANVIFGQKAASGDGASSIPASRIVFGGGKDGTTAVAPSSSFLSSFGFGKPAASRFGNAAFGQSASGGVAFGRLSTPTGALQADDWTKAIGEGDLKLPESKWLIYDPDKLPKDDEDEDENGLDGDVKGIEKKKEEEA
jgi:hypothetical protein